MKSLSKCCKAKVFTQLGDEGTNFWTCSDCGKSCDIIGLHRKKDGKCPECGSDTCDARFKAVYHATEKEICAGTSGTGAKLIPLAEAKWSKKDHDKMIKPPEQAEDWEKRIRNCRGYDNCKGSPFIVFDDKNEIWDSNDLADFISEQIKKAYYHGRTDFKHEMQLAITEEINLANNEGEPTSRLTALWNKLFVNKHGSI